MTDDDEFPTLFDSEPEPMKPWQGGPDRQEMEVEATRRRERALIQVEAHAEPEVRRTLIEAVKLVSGRKPSLTSEDVHLAFEGDEPREPRVLGAVMREAKARGWIVPTDEWRLSVRPESHRRPMRVWRSLRFGVVE